PKFSSNQRSYITVAIGCTGGVHRSVYLTERLKAWYVVNHSNVQIHHRELTNKGKS
ncbi:MAG: RNase adapter RapZ, partial [Pseudomonadota bacterium]